MKKIILSIMAVASLVACTNDEVVSFDKQEIAFGSAFVDNSTRAAADNTYGEGSTITKMNVYGTVSAAGGTNTSNIFAGIPVENKTESGTTAGYGNVWYYAPQYTQYWVNGAKYNFVAIVDGDADNNGTIESSEVKVNTTTGMPEEIYYTASTQKDLLCVASPVTSKPENGVVSFSFNHLLSKVKFTVTGTAAANSSDYTYNVKDITINNTSTTGTYNVSNVSDVSGTWGSQNTNGSTLFGAIDGYYDGVANECDTEMLVIPTEAETTLNISFTVQRRFKGKVIAEEVYSGDKAIKKSVNLKQNHSYNFMLTVGLAGKIDFTVYDSMDWKSTTPGDITIQ